MKKVLFIINPISGNRKKRQRKKTEYNIRKYIDNKKFEAHFAYTEYVRHAVELSKNAIDDGFDIVVAVGGDGTVNEVAESLIHSNVQFGIIPLGSGNGLARALKIPLNLKKAVKVINKGKPVNIDTLKVNDNYCINIAGVGFDAHISHLFAKAKKRGLKTYGKLIVNEFFKYKSPTYDILIDHKKEKHKAFLISFANSTQFGNSAHIAPLADIRDGLMDVCILKQFPAWQSISMASRLFSKTIHNSKYYTLKKTAQIELINSKPLELHIDGEPFTFNSNIKISIIPKSLQVLIFDTLIPSK